MIKEKQVHFSKKISFVQKDLYATTEIETKRWIEPIDESARDSSINALILPETFKFPPKMAPEVFASAVFALSKAAFACMKEPFAYNAAEFAIACGVFAFKKVFPSRPITSFFNVVAVRIYGISHN